MHRRVFFSNCDLDWLCKSLNYGADLTIRWPHLCQDRATSREESRDHTRNPEVKFEKKNSILKPNRADLCCCVPSLVSGPLGNKYVHQTFLGEKKVKKESLASVLGPLLNSARQTGNALWTRQEDIFLSFFFAPKLLRCWSYNSCYSY